MKKVIQKVPLPLCGVMLGFAALGNLLQSYSEGIRYVCGGIAAFLLVLILMKLVMFPEMIKEDLKNPILASVVGTFPMALMLLSTYIKPLIGAGAKYIWFSSSSKKGGTGSGSRVHLAGNPSARVVYVIEGLLKADISHCLTGRTFAAIAGANNTSPLDAMFALLAQSGTEEIIEAHDMDKYNNKMTMAGASKIYLMAQKHGMNCRRLTWNPNYKGFDDWQLALRQGSQRQKEIEKLSFKEQYLRGLCKLAHIEDCVEQWQHRAEQDIGLTEYLGLTGEEHKTFLCGGRDALAALLEPQRRKQRFVLYQLQLDEENAIPFAFKDITALKAAGYEQPPAAMYYVAGSGEIYCPAEESDDTLLKRLFADCRERLPEGCRGRPMAVSDVVELNHGAKRAYYYVSGQDQFRQVKFSPMLAKKEIPEKTQERF